MIFTDSIWANQQESNLRISVKSALSAFYQYSNQTLADPDHFIRFA